MGKHSTPRQYLRGFCDPDGLIFQYEKGVMKAPVRTGVNRVAQSKELYPSNLEEELNLKIEVPANKLLNQLRRGQMISVEDKTVFSEYIVNMIKRTSKGLDRVRRHAPQTVDNTLKDTEDYVRNLIRIHPQNRNIIENGWQKALQEGEKWKDDPRIPWYTILPPNKTPKSVEAISKLIWIFYITDKPAFLTSDNPIFYTEDIGVGSARGMVCFPISSTIALEATNLVSRSMIFYKADDRIVTQINERTIQYAARFIYHCEDSSEVLQLVNMKR